MKQTQPQSAPKLVTGDDTDIRYLIAHHDSQITTLAERMATVDGRLDVQSKKLDQIIQSLAIQSSRPEFDATKTISVVKDLGVMIGMAVAAIIWVTTGQFSANFTRYEEANKQTVEKIISLDRRITQVESKK